MEQLNRVYRGCRSLVSEMVVNVANKRFQGLLIDQDFEYSASKRTFVVYEASVTLSSKVLFDTIQIFMSFG